MTCSKCGIKASSFGTTFFGEKCSSCMTLEELNDHDIVSANRDFLDAFLRNAKGSRKTYDCLVPVRADAEDYYTVGYLIDRGLNPLVVLVNNFFLNDIGWYNFHNLITHYDVDSVAYSPNYVSYLEMVRSSLRKFGSIYYPYKAIQHSYVMRLAKEKNIPAVIWGQCQPLEFSGKFSRSERLFLSQWWIQEHETNGINPERFLGTGVQLNASDAWMIRYPEISEVSGVNSIFLSNFLVWDQFAQNLEASDKGFVVESCINTYDCLENTGSSVYYQIHDLLRIQAKGYPKLHEHVARDTRYGRWALNIGSKILADIESYVAYNIEPFFKDFLGVTSSGFKWFLKNRLAGVNHLVRATPEKNIRDKVDHLFAGPLPPQGIDPKRHFVRFMKGI